MFDFANQLTRAQFVTFVLVSISNFFSFIAVLTPAWQVAEDLDVGRSVQSGLWIYCPGAQQCWYIFSDDLINYYERVDVCRFFLVGDCRKKLLRTPYFFGWHYAVLVLMIIALALSTITLVAIAVAYFRRHTTRIATIVMDVTLSISFLLICIALAVFMINAEMLESRFLIGVKNTFPKSYGYSFYLACVGVMIMLFSLLAAGLVSAQVFFFSEGDVADEELYNNAMSSKTFLNGGGRGTGLFHPTDGGQHYAMQQQQQQQQQRPSSLLSSTNEQNGRRYRMMQEAPSPHTPTTAQYLDGISEFSVGNPAPRHCYSPSDMSIPTRTFLSY